MKGSLVRKALWLSLFAMAMAYLEATVVVYLRELYYPKGFHFPLNPMPIRLVWVELAREASTIVMLLAVAVLAGEKGPLRFAHFMYIFGIWDIFYYIWLKVVLGWPESLLTWDLLFLIPLPWVGPVLAPILVSIGLIAAAIIIYRMECRGIPFRPGWSFWAMEILAGCIVILSFLWEWKMVPQGDVPERFNWGLFLSGYLLGWVTLIRVLLPGKLPLSPPHGQQTYEGKQLALEKNPHTKREDT
jgi:hypothetical protein